MCSKININCNNINFECSNCYECVNCEKCNDCAYCHDCRNYENCENCINYCKCKNCKNCINCYGCENCINCYGLLDVSNLKNIICLMTHDGPTYYEIIDNLFNMSDIIKLSKTEQENILLNIDKKLFYKNCESNNCENSIFCKNSNNCNKCRYCSNCDNCSNCYGCKNCINCYGCYTRHDLTNVVYLSGIYYKLTDNSFDIKSINELSPDDQKNLLRNLKKEKLM